MTRGGGTSAPHTRPGLFPVVQEENGSPAPGFKGRHWDPLGLSLPICEVGFWSWAGPGNRQTLQTEGEVDEWLGGFRTVEAKGPHPQPSCSSPVVCDLSV